MAHRRTPLKRRDLAFNQDLIINTQSVGLNGVPFYTPGTPFNINVEMPASINIPTTGQTTIRLAKIYFDSADVVPATSKLISITSSDLPLMDTVITTTQVGNGIIATFPVLNAGVQLYEGTIDSDISAPLFDNTQFRRFNLKMHNQAGEPITFNTVGPIIQFKIETEFTDSDLQAGTLLVNHMHQA